MTSTINESTSNVFDRLRHKVDGYYAGYGPARYNPNVRPTTPFDDKTEYTRKQRMDVFLEPLYDLLIELTPYAGKSKFQGEIVRVVQLIEDLETICEEDLERTFVRTEVSSETIKTKEKE